VSDQHLIGTEQDDFLEGAEGNDWLEGLAANDTLVGNDGNDLLDGGAGNDSFDGGAGNDVYVLGDLGFDGVVDIGGDDEVRMPAGISPDQVERIRFNGSDNLQLRMAGTGESLTLVNWFLDPTFQVERVVFDGGTVWAPAETSALRWLGTAGSEFLAGTQYDETFEGRGGNDSFDGGAGNDVYVLGDLGFDGVVDIGGDDEVRMPAGISPDQVERIRFNGSDNLQLRMAGTGESLTLVNWFLDPTFQVERVVFDGGTVWDPATTASLRYLGTEGNDFLTGSFHDERIEGRDGNDVIDGREGADALAGGAGNDIYVVGAGIGADTIFDVADASGGNQVRFDAHLSGDIRLGYDNGGTQLAFLTASGEELLKISGFDRNDVFGGTRAVQEFVFLDGTLSYEQLLARGFDIFASGSIAYDPVSGTNIHDRVYGSSQTDTLSGMDGDDSVFGGGGDDTLHGDGGQGVGNDYLDGGAGNDSLLGRRGSDTYYFDRLGGHDSIIEQVTLEDDQGDVDRVVFGPDISPEDLAVSLDSYGGLVVAINGSPASLTVQGWFSTETSSRIERFEFRDGTVLSDAVLEAMLNDAPVVANPLADLSTAEDAVFSFTVPADSFADSDPYDSLSYVASLGNGSALPAWLAFDAGTRTFTGTPANGQVGTITLRVTVTDERGLSASDVFDLTVTNTNDAPVAVNDSFSVDEDWALRLGRFSLVPNDFDIDPTGDVLTIVSVQNAQHGSVSLDEFQNTLFIPDANYNGPASFEYIISDGNGGLATATVSINMLAVNDTPTVANPIADQAATEDAPFSFAVPAGTFSDVESSSFTYSASLADDTELPAWLNFDAESGAFSGTPANEDVGVLSLKVTATDTGALSVSDVFDVAIANTNDAPVLANFIPQQEALEDAPFSFTLPQDTFLDVDAGDTLTYSATLDDMFFSPLPDWLTLDGATGTFSGTPTNDEVGFLNIRVVASDQSGMQGFASFWLGVTNTNDAPTLVSPLADQAASEDQAFSFTVPAGAFADVDAGDTLSYAAVLVGNHPLPGWLSFNFLNRTFSGTPGNADVGSISVKVFVSDDFGLFVTDIFDLTVANTNDAPTLANAIADQSAAEDSAFAYTVPANAFADVDIGDTLAYSATLADGSALPSWLSFDALTRTFNGTPVNADVGMLAIRLTATDGSGAAASDVFDLTVTNTNDAPALANALADQTAQDTVAFSYVVPANSFADIDAGDVLLYTAALTSGAALPAWLVFDAATRTFSGTPGVADMGTLDVRVTVADGAGAQASDVFAITVAAAPDQTITGTAGNDTLVGASGNDTIDGLGGADGMSGGLGNDLYYVNQSGDVVIENTAAGVDTVRSSITYTLAANVENLELIGTAAINGTGNALDNILSGNAANNRLSGAAGNDTYIITQSGDTVVENSGGGVDAVHASISYSLGNHVENLVLTGNGNINGTGNSLANWLTGNSGSNTLKGGGGADSLSGGAGNDTLTGGSGSDAFYFLEAPGAGNADHITDFAAGERLYLEDLVHPDIGAAGIFAPNDARFFAAAGASSGADASDRVVYDTASGRLYYDADGSGAGAPTLVAILDNVFALSASDIAVS
jgi:Ca2+-binding RTX toxin-like protein